jgi:chlorophyll synthase
MNAIFLITRPWYWLPSLASTTSGLIWASQAGHRPIGRIILALITIGPGLSAYAEVINEIADIRFDRGGSPKLFWRLPLGGGTGVLTSETMPYKAAIGVAAAAGILTVLASAALSPVVLLCSILGLCVATLYSIPPFRLKGRPLASILAQAAGYGPIAFYIGFLSMSNNITRASILISLLIGAWVGCLGLTADLLDFEDDRRERIRTLCVRAGRTVASLVIIFVPWIVCCAAWLLLCKNIFEIAVAYCLLSIMLVGHSALVWKYRFVRLPPGVHAFTVLLEVLFPLICVGTLP